MAKTETAVSNLKINRGTLANIEANLSSIGENELIITTDKNIPVPAVADSGKVVKVNASGEYELGNVSSVSYLTTAPSADNTSGQLAFVVLSDDTGITKYNGYIYLITGSNS